jgi:hypothetical protein
MQIHLSQIIVLPAIHHAQVPGQEDLKSHWHFNSNTRVRQQSAAARADLRLVTGSARGRRRLSESGGSKSRVPGPGQLFKLRLCPSLRLSGAQATVTVTPAAAVRSNSERLSDFSVRPTRTVTVRLSGTSS